jgi:hypothetical protein
MVNYVMHNIDYSDIYISNVCPYIPYQENYHPLNDAINAAIEEYVKWTI